MILLGLSFSHFHVPIALREKIHFDEDAIANAYARFRCGDDTPVETLELAILSTCNRTEFYLLCDADPAESHRVSDAIFDDVLNFIAESRNVTVDELRSHARCYHGPEVVEHMCRVASGLESSVLGEPQILGQVGDMLRLSLAINSIGAVLNKLIQVAIRAGRRARTETEINVNSLNISSVAVNMVERDLGGVAGKTVLVLGAGEMAELALKQLQALGAGSVIVVNRTLARAKELAGRFAGEAYVFEHLFQLMPQADVLISSTGAPHTLITRSIIEMAMMHRSDRPLAIIDIAIPRDVELEVGQVAGVTRCDLDDLQTAAGERAALREQQVPLVESIIRAEVDQYLCWFRSIGVESTVVALRKKAEAIRQDELKRLQAILPPLDEKSWAMVEKFSKSLSNKLLHDPTTRLRDLHGSRHAVDYAEAIRVLYSLDADPSQPQSPAVSQATAEQATAGEQTTGELTAGGEESSVGVPGPPKLGQLRSQSSNAKADS